MGPSSSSSSPEKSYGGEEYYHNLEITDESPLDGEVCKRLNQLIPVPVSGAYLNYIDVFCMSCVNVLPKCMYTKYAFKVHCRTFSWLHRFIYEVAKYFYILQL